MSKKIAIDCCLTKNLNEISTNLRFFKSIYSLKLIENYQSKKVNLPYCDIELYKLLKQNRALKLFCIVIDIKANPKKINQLIILLKSIPKGTQLSLRIIPGWISHLDFQNCFWKFIQEWKYMTLIKLHLKLNLEFKSIKEIIDIVNESDKLQYLSLDFMTKEAQEYAEYYLLSNNSSKIVKNNIRYLKLDLNPLVPVYPDTELYYRANLIKKFPEISSFYFKLSKIPLNKNLIEVIFRNLKLYNLQKLEIYFDKIHTNSNECIALFNCLTYFPKLTLLTIFLPKNSIDDKAVYILAKEILPVFQQLKFFSFFIEQNFVTNEGISCLIKSLSNIKSLEVCNLDFFYQNNLIGDFFKGDDLSKSNIHTFRLVMGFVPLSLFDTIFRNKASFKNLKTLDLKIYFHNYETKDSILEYISRIFYGLTNIEELYLYIRFSCLDSSQYDQTINSFQITNFLNSLKTLTKLKSINLSVILNIPELIELCVKCVKQLAYIKRYNFEF